MTANGGNGNHYGGGGSGGFIVVNYNKGSFYSDHTYAFGGNAGGYGSSEAGSPGLVFLNGLTPLNRNLRIDNKGKSPKVRLIKYLRYFIFS